MIKDLKLDSVIYKLFQVACVSKSGRASEYVAIELNALSMTGPKSDSPRQLQRPEDAPPPRAPRPASGRPMQDLRARLQELSEQAHGWRRAHYSDAAARKPHPRVSMTDSEDLVHIPGPGRHASSGHRQRLVNSTERSLRGHASDVTGDCLTDSNTRSCHSLRQSVNEGSMAGACSRDYPVGKFGAASSIDGRLLELQGFLRAARQGLQSMKSEPEPGPVYL